MIEFMYMKKIIVLVFILVGILVVFLTFSGNKTSAPLNNNANLSDSDMSANSEDTQVMMSQDRYSLYTGSAFAEAKEYRRVIFFYANWCPTCRPADADFTQNKNSVPEDVRIFRVNYNDPDTDSEERDLARKYDVTYQHTFVQVDNEGNVVTKWNGGKLSELLTNIM